MAEQREVSATRTWGCLAVGMILFGAFFVELFESVGGTQYELRYTAKALIVAGAAILLVLLAKRLRR